MARLLSSDERDTRLLASRGTLRRILLENILPFWTPERIVDETHGGYRLNHDARGRWLGDIDKMIMPQARVVWFFSRLYLSPFGAPSHLDLARKGYTFLRDHMWDAEAGGFFWQVDPSGRPTHVHKHILGQSFPLYALTAFAQASGDGEARTLADKTFDFIEARGHDPDHGGYFRVFERDWTPMTVEAASALRVDPRIKQANEQLHVLEAYAPYFRLTNAPLVRTRIVELVDLLLETMIDGETGQGVERCTTDWTPVRITHRDQVEFGHDIERIWIAVDALEAIGSPAEPIAGKALRLFDATVRFGYDARNGGFYERGPTGQRAADRSKSWWAQAEALVTSLCLYQFTGEPRCAQSYLETLDWIVERHVDGAHLEWHAWRTRSHKLRGPKASQIKTPYHNGRAMLRCLDALGGCAPANDA